MFLLRLLFFLFLLRHGVATNLFKEGSHRRLFSWPRQAAASVPEADPAGTPTMHSTPASPISLSSIHRAVVRSTAGTLSAFGFATSISVGLLTGKAQFGQLKPTVDAMQAYLEETGISQELGKSFTAKLFDNVVILWRIQKQYRKTHDLRDIVAMKRNQNQIPDMEEASRYIRYATAAYGDQMIRAARLSRLARRTGKLFASTRERISQHVNVPEEDIVIMDIDYGGDRQHLHHFVAKDHANKVVVLAIRGTFSIRDIVVDAAAFTRPFCGGEAHNEMAQMAERTWDAAGPYILSALEQHEDYSLVITGHSLGAGVACLLNMLCHQRGRERVLGRNVKCFAYGCPPVFSALELVPDAVASTTSYIHGSDGVPFLSLGHVRRLVSTLQWIDHESSKPLEKTRLIYGKKGPNKKMISAALQGNTIVPKKGSPILAVPASSVIWTQEKKCGHFDFKICDPKQVSMLGIQISANFLADHALASYEEALHYLEDAS